ncbi:hypothetical protein MP228_001325 [Amoeboaphelidium protococcarum]|nr:hypothetical protein MP228_001325 [Amoeboaphelidium protococcarum]
MQLMLVIIAWKQWITIVLERGTIQWRNILQIKAAQYHVQYVDPYPLVPSKSKFVSTLKNSWPRASSQSTVIMDNQI